MSPRPPALSLSFHASTPEYPVTLRRTVSCINPTLCECVVIPTAMHKPPMVASIISSVHASVHLGMLECSNCGQHQYEARASARNRRQELATSRGCFVHLVCRTEAKHPSSVRKHILPAVAQRYV